MSIRSGFAVGAGTALVLAAPLAAQSPDLDGIEELARLGRSEEARTALMTWWSGPRDDASRRDLQRGLWLRGRLTVDPVQADLDFQRLVVLYPNGPFTPRALFRLAQSAHAQGNADGARGHIETLARDYPASPSRSDAEAWLSRAGPPLPQVADPPPQTGRSDPVGTTGTTVAGAPVTDAPGTDPPAGDDPADAPDPAVPPGASVDVPLNWMVQFGAFAEEARALSLHSELVDAGVDARLVRVQGSGFLHVRIGRFGTRVDANDLLEQIAAQGFTAAIVRDDRLEEVIGR